MPGSIPIENTYTVDQLNPVIFALVATDLLLLSRAAGLEAGEYKLTLQQLQAFITNGFAPLSSPAFTDTPTVPLAPENDDSDQIASTAFVQNVAGSLYNLISQKVDIASIVDDLLSMDNQVPLSANQGRLLKDLIDELTLSFSTAGLILPWKPNTNFYTATTVMDIPVPAQIVEHEGSLYVVLQDFTSGVNFSEKDGATVVLSRLRMDSDKDYLEIMFAGSMPLLPNQELGAYMALRSFNIEMQHALPNDRLGGASVMHLGLANTGLSGNNVVTIKRLNYSDGTTDTVGTITFGTVPATNGTPAAFAFNDARSDSPTTKIVATKGDVLLFELTTVTPELTWLRVNMLGTYVNYTSPYFSASFGG